MPTLAVMPSPSARARAYDTTDPRMRQARASAAVRRSSPPPVNHRTRPPNTAASPTRSNVESRYAPHRLDAPERRAMMPSTVSENTKAVTTIVPASR
jgi:hypothetical protein